jgi:ABC-type uncharacterized transport system substrate-binding protein
MKTLALVAILVVSLLPAPLAAEAQQAGGYRLGHLSLLPVDRRLDSFRQGLRDLGYLEGRNIVLEILSAEGKPDRLPDLAAQYVRRKVDLIVTDTGTAAVAAKKATQTIPIVMLVSGDAVRQGLVTSLARPGGNVTGLTMTSPEVSRKRLELLREMLPKLSHVGVLGCGPGSPVAKQEWVETQAAADVLGVRLSFVEAHGREDLAGICLSVEATRRSSPRVRLLSSHPKCRPNRRTFAETSLAGDVPFPHLSADRQLHELRREF